MVMVVEEGAAVCTFSSVELICTEKLRSPSKLESSIMVMSVQTCSLSVVKDRLAATEEREKSVPSVEREREIGSVCVEGAASRSLVA